MIAMRSLKEEKVESKYEGADGEGEEKNEEEERGMKMRSVRGRKRTRRR